MYHLGSSPSHDPTFISFVAFTTLKLASHLFLWFTLYARPSPEVKAGALPVWLIRISAAPREASRLVPGTQLVLNKCCWSEWTVKSSLLKGQVGPDKDCFLNKTETQWMLWLLPSKGNHMLQSISIKDLFVCLLCNGIFFFHFENTIFTPSDKNQI